MRPYKRFLAAMGAAYTKAYDEAKAVALNPKSTAADNRRAMRCLEASRTCGRPYVLEIAQKHDVLTCEFAPNARQLVSAEALQFVQHLVRPCPSITVIRSQRLPKGVLGQYVGSVVYMGDGAGAITFVHEIGHHIEDTLNFGAESREILRTVTNLPTNYMRTCYAGSGTEVVSCLFEQLWVNPIHLAKMYPDLFDWIIHKVNGESNAS
jgi:hypothetical protein